MTPNKAELFIGTSGWTYDHWKGPFYPDELPRTRWLEFYCEHFRSVEINNTFYQLPKKDTLRNWGKRVPDGFLFSVKASSYITHAKKLKDPEQSVHRFLDHISVLQDRLGPVLFQLPPRWHFNRERLATFLEALSRDFSYVFEFRDRSWLNQDTQELLSKHNAALCFYDLEGFQSPKDITADFIYVRLHGPDAAYQGSYPTSSLAGWAGALSSWSSRGRTVFCYFNNDQNGHAVNNALSLQSMLSHR